MEARVLLIVAAAIAITDVAICGPLFEPVVLIWAGDIPGYGEALESIIAAAGTTTILVQSEGAFRGLVNLPQVRCVVLATFTPADYAFLEKFAPVLQKHFEEGGSFVGIGPVCSSVILEPLATTIFPIDGNATGMGRKMDDIFGSIYTLSQPIQGISSSLPAEFALTQFQYVFRSGPDGPLEPESEAGTATVVYRDGESGAPMVVAFERDGGGRSVSLPGCFIATIERLPYYWGDLLGQDEFADLLRGSLTWAMEGSARYQTLGLNAEEKLTEEAGEASAARQAAENARRSDRLKRLAWLAGIWAVGLLLDAFLLVRYVLPRLRS